MDSLFFIRCWFPRGDGNGFSVVVDGNEDDEAVAGAAKGAVAGVGGEHFVDDVHRGSAGVGDCGSYFDEVSGGDGACEMDVSDVCRNTVGARPADGTGVGRFVDPLEDTTAVDAHGTGEEDIVGGGEESQSDAVVALLAWLCVVGGCGVVRSHGVLLLTCSSPQCCGL